MHILPIFNVVGILLLVLGTAQIFPLGMAWLYDEPDWVYFLASGLGILAIGGVVHLACRKAREISEKDGFAIVTFGWIAAAAAGAVPYYLTGTVSTFTDAFFESMSGFTTTGSSIFVEYDGISHGILLWRSMTQWFGGMGIIVLALVILPTLGIGGMQLYKREVPGPYSEKITPHLRDTAKALWSVYLLLTIVEIIILYVLGMSGFDAVNHALTTISTGGFSTRGGSVGEFASPVIEWVIIIFMLFGGMNFALHYRFIMRPAQGNAYWKDLEWRYYVFITFFLCLVVSLYLMVERGYEGFTAFTKGTFQVISIMTTTGYGSDDYVLWGAFPQILLVLMMIVGGCAGSTAGGVKWVRVILVFSFIRQEMVRLVHPKVVIHTKLGHATVTRDILGNILAFIFLFLTTLAVVTLLISLDGHSILTSIGAAASALGNIGPGLDAVGPTQNYFHLSDYSKWVLIAAMLCGRLELMTVFVLFSPRLLWR